MPSYLVEIPGRGKFKVESPTDLTDEQAYYAALNISPQKLPTIGGYIGETLKAVPRGFVGGLEQAALGAAALLPGDTESGFEKTAREAIKSTAEKLKPTVAPGYEETIPVKLGEAVGSFGSLLGPGGIGGLAARGLGFTARAGQLAATAPTAVSMGAGEARERAVTEGATPEQITQATLWGTLPGGLELLSVERVFRVMPKEIKAGIFNRIERAFVTGGFEGAQEAASAVAQNFIAQKIYKPSQELIEGVGENAAYGFGAGAIVQFLLDAVAGRRAAPKVAPPTPSAAAGAVPPAAPPTVQTGLPLEAPVQPATVPQPAFAPSGRVYTPEQLELSKMQAETRERRDMETAAVEDQLRDLRNIFDIYQNENQRINTAYAASTDPQERVDLFTKATQVASTLEQLNDQITALKKQSAGLSRPGSAFAERALAEAGQTSFDFEAPPAAAALKEEPSKVPNTIRVYHSGQKGEGESGRWVSTNKNYASNYRPNLPLFYTDIPANDPRVNNFDYPEQSAVNGFTFNFELTPQEATTLKEIPRQKAAPPPAPVAPAAATAVQKQKTASELRLLDSDQQTKIFADMTLEQLQATRDSADQVNLQLDLNAIRKYLGENAAKQYEAMGYRARNSWWEKNATEALERESSVYQGINEETIDKYIRAFNNFDTESPKNLGRSIALIVKDIDQPNFKNSPEFVTLKNALMFAKQQGWSENEVIDAMRSRAAEWAGADAKELFKSLFKSVPVAERKPSAPALPSTAPPPAPAAPRQVTDADLKQMGIAAPKLRADLKKFDVSTPEGYTAFMDTLGNTKAKVNW